MQPRFYCVCQLKKNNCHVMTTSGPDWAKSRERSLWLVDSFGSKHHGWLTITIALNEEKIYESILSAFTWPVGKLLETFYLTKHTVELFRETLMLIREGGTIALVTSVQTKILWHCDYIEVCFPVAIRSTSIEVPPNLYKEKKRALAENSLQRIKCARTTELLQRV